MSNRMVSNSFATIIPLCSVRSIFAMHLVKDMLDFFPFKLWNNWSYNENERVYEAM